MLVLGSLRSISITRGDISLFASLDPNKFPLACPGGLGLTTALVALQSGCVIVGSLPTKNGSSASAQAGCLIVLDSSGNPVETITGPLINGPWDMTALDNGRTTSLFATNVLNGTLGGSPKHRRRRHDRPDQPIHADKRRAYGVTSFQTRPEVCGGRMSGLRGKRPLA